MLIYYAMSLWQSTLLFKAHEIRHTCKRVFHLPTLASLGTRLVGIKRALWGAVNFLRTVIGNDSSNAPAWHGMTWGHTTIASTFSALTFRNAGNISAIGGNTQHSGGPGRFPATVGQVLHDWARPSTAAHLPSYSAA
jgi:hypothetical protein